MKISIPEPCSEDWSKMTPTEKGAFCQKCALEVTDFTNKTALEIKSILTEKIESKQRVCGHIENRQLIELNNDFIPWKSDQESFRAVWMFSLIAVFGMTLFSCQSTFSKEIVEKMNVSSMEMIDEDEKDTLDLARLNDSIKMIPHHDTLSTATIRWNDVFGGPIVMQGGFSGGLEIPFWEPLICINWTGTLALDGFVSIDPAPEEDTVNQANLILNPLQARYISPNKPVAPSEPTQQVAQRIIAKHEKGKPDFTAYISPNPINPTSKLYLTIPEEGILRLSIWELSSRSKIHSERFELVFGNHTADINFMDFPTGKYAAQLIWEEEKVVLPFEVLRNPIT